MIHRSNLWKNLARNRTEQHVEAYVSLPAFSCFTTTVCLQTSSLGFLDQLAESIAPKYPLVIKYGNGKSTRKKPISLASACANPRQSGSPEFKVCGRQSTQCRLGTRDRWCCLCLWAGGIEVHELEMGPER